MLPFPNSLFSVIPWENKFPGKQLLNCGNTVQKPFGKHYRSDEKGTGKQKCWTKEKNKERWKTLNLSLKKANLLWMKEKGKGGEAFWQLSTQTLPLSISPLFPLVSAKGNRVDIDQDLETFSPRPKLAQFGDPDRGGKKRLCGFSFPFFSKATPPKLRREKNHQLLPSPNASFPLPPSDKIYIFAVFFFGESRAVVSCLFPSVLFPLSVSSNQCLFFLSPFVRVTVPGTQARKEREQIKY